MNTFVKLLLFMPLACLFTSCHPGVTGPPGENIHYTTTLDPATARLRPGQSVTFAFSAKRIDGPITDSLSFFPSEILWTLEGTPAYTVGTVVPITDPPTFSEKIYCRFDAAPSLPQGVTQVQVTLRAKVNGQLGGNILQATSSITVDLNAPAQAPSDDQSAGRQP